MTVARTYSSVKRAAIVIMIDPPEYWAAKNPDQASKALAAAVAMSKSMPATRQQNVVPM